MTELDFLDKWYYFLLVAIACYMVGCFNFAVIISHLKSKDIRDEGSGNPGTLNMTRTFGLKVGIINFLCDVIKGGVPALVGYILFKDYNFKGTQISVSDFARYFCGLFVVIGHIFPITLKFKGGKGIASTLGLFIFGISCEKWWYIFCIICVFVLLFIYMAISQLGSMASLVSVSVFTVWQAAIFVVRYLKTAHLLLILLMSMLLLVNILTWFAHRKNIYRLLGGEEHKTTIIKKKNKIK